MKTPFRAQFFFIFAVFTFLSLGRTTIAGGAKVQTPQVSSVAGELLVAFQNKEIATKIKSALFKKYQGVEKDDIASSGTLFLVSFPPQVDLLQVQNALSKESGVRYAEPNLKVRSFEKAH